MCASRRDRCIFVVWSYTESYASPFEECICDKGWRKSASTGCEWDCDTVDTLGCTGPGQLDSSGAMPVQDTRETIEAVSFVWLKLEQHLQETLHWWFMTSFVWVLRVVFSRHLHRSKRLWKCLSVWELHWWKLPLLGWLSWHRLFNSGQHVVSAQRCSLWYQRGHNAFHVRWCNEDHTSLDQHLGCWYTTWTILLSGRQYHVDQPAIWMGQRIGNWWKLRWLCEVFETGLSAEFLEHVEIYTVL